tara:strand:- start:215 stop:478 length:264 start_codon:yes stop_codon:yes gene_type:complete
MPPKKDVKSGEKTYQIRPQFKDKFRPGEAKEKLEKIVHNKLKTNSVFTAQELNQLTKDIAAECLHELKALQKDKRYKFLIQCTLGHN